MKNPRARGAAWAASPVPAGPLTALRSQRHAQFARRPDDAQRVRLQPALECLHQEDLWAALHAARDALEPAHRMRTLLRSLRAHRREQAAARDMLGGHGARHASSRAEGGTRGSAARKAGSRCRHTQS